MSFPLFHRQVLLLFSMLSLAGAAHGDARSWEFDLKTPGTYKVQVRHDVERAMLPQGTVATYSIESKEKTIKRDDPYLTLGQPVIPLVLDVTRPQKARVVIEGVPAAVLKQTTVYVFERNTNYPDEYLDPKKTVDVTEVKAIRQILKQPEQRIDLARANLSIDKMIDPSIDIQANLRSIETIVTRIRTMAGPNASSTATALAIKRYLYEPGEWNDQRPFQYDLNDPLGTKISNKLLPTYLSSRKGNCVSMPFLFIVLGQRLGIDVTASTAPLHVFVKFKDETGAMYNLETTSGANPARDVWYREQMPMTDKAIASGVYLRPLSKREMVALMATTLLEHFVEQGEFEKAIALSDLILEYYPKSVQAMVTKGSAHYALMNKYYAGKYRSPDEVPDRLKGHFQYLSQNNVQWFAKAEALGWREPKKEDEEKYLQKISQERQIKRIN